MGKQDRSVAAFDPDAFYPFRALVEGPFTQLDDLTKLERFFRAIILHDEMRMVIEPWPDPGNDEADEEIGPEGRNVIVAVGPTLTEYENLLVSPIGLKKEIKITLPPKLLSLAAELSRGEGDNPYYRAYVEYFQQLADVLGNSGSVVCEGEAAARTELLAKQYPGKLFESLDADWQRIAREIDAGRFGPALPPIVALVLQRAQVREAIPVILRDLRDELATARTSVWTAIRRLGSGRTVREMSEAFRELDNASHALSVLSGDNRSSSGRVLWDIMGGTISAGVAGGLTGVAGAIIGSIITRVGDRLTSPLLSGSAVDLGRRLGRGLVDVDPSAKELGRILGPSERAKLRL
jgi:hypothetical protein